MDCDHPINFKLFIQDFTVFFNGPTLGPHYNIFSNLKVLTTPDPELNIDF